MIEMLFLMARLDFDLRHAALIHAPGTELEKVATQERFREEARHVVFSADGFDTDLAAIDVVTMLEESNVEVLVLTRSRANSVLRNALTSLPSGHGRFG